MNSIAQIVQSMSSESTEIAKLYVPLFIAVGVAGAGTFYNCLDPSSFYAFSFFIALVLAGILYQKQRQFLRALQSGSERLKLKVLLTIYPLVLYCSMLLVCVSLAKLVNGVSDSSATYVLPLSVEEKQIFKMTPTLKYRLPGTARLHSLSVEQSEYDRARVGESKIEFTLRSGRLGAPWIVSHRLVL